VAQGPVFLIGGGRNESAFPYIYGRFAAALGSSGTPGIACVLLDDDERDEYVAHYSAAFAAVGVGDLSPIFVSRERPLRATDLDGADGAFVGGGLTPAYHDATVPTAGEWLPWLRDRGIPYAGFSAGASIAPTHAIVGGWKLRRGAADLAICHEDVGEDEEFLDIRPGLGLVPFAVDPHASQWGTLTRLLHAVRAGLVPSGWAIDEDTMIEVAAGMVAVHGLGSAYRVRRNDDALMVEILGHGDGRDIA
jgi:cyanophycinase